MSIICGECGILFEGSMCPKCTIPIKLKRKTTETKVDDLLIRVAVLEVQVKQLLAVLDRPMSHKKTV